MNLVYVVLSSLFAGVCGYMLVTALLDRTYIKKQSIVKHDREQYLKSSLYRFFVNMAGIIINIHPEKERLSGYFKRVKKRLSLAGEPLCLMPEELLVMKELTCIITLIICILLGFSIGVSIILSVGAFFYPDLWLKELYQKRRTIILKELPYILDLLTLSIEAGLDLTGSVSRILDKSKHGIVRMELFQFLQELKMGKARKQALTDMADRVGVPEITSLVNAIIQSDELGTGLARTLRIQSREYRTKRFQRAEKLAMEAPVKMTFPLLFIFSAVFLLLFGSFVVQAFRGKLF
ncbi:MAG: type II secretion system F family protein [bacterium]